MAVAAFEYAVKNKRPKVTVAHKANILKKCDGLFLDMVREVSKDYPQIILEEVIVDNMAMQIVMNPAQFSVIVTTNLYGDVLSDLSAGLIGGLGLVPGANIGKDMAIFEPVHGSAPDIAGKGIANPTACMLSAVLMLEHIGELDKASTMRSAIIETLENPSSRTGDLGGNLSTMDFADAVIKNLLDRSDK